MKCWWLVCLLTIVSCGENETKVSENKPVTETNFFEAFSSLPLPFATADTSLANLADTTSVSAALLRKLVPDSVSAILLPKQPAAGVLHPVGKIDKPSETYLLLTVPAGRHTKLVALLFNDKQQYTGYLPLIASGNNDGYVHSVNINTEPTFTITRDKTVKDNFLYTKTGYAYSASAKGFIEVINESNEDVAKNREVINPIDTLPKTFKYSGDYAKDKANFISVRDGLSPGKYLFFLHTEKKGTDCGGELKGTLSMVDASKAVFQQSGDPCVIDFVFGSKTLKVKERGSCGNHRGMNCLFDDNYKKTVQPAKKKK